MNRSSPLLSLKALGQSVWLDDIRRAWLHDGTFAGLISKDGLSGVTSNPAIFRNAILNHRDYDEAIAGFARQGADAADTAEDLMVADLSCAAGLFRAVYDASSGRDGFVSLEVSPHVAGDSDATVSEALRLWMRLRRANAMIKVPATPAGLIAIRRLVAEGVNVNVTLLFSVDRYRKVVDAWRLGLQDRVAANQPIERVASVASFFLSRIDSLVDSRLDALRSPEAAQLRGEAAIASARLAYQHFREWAKEPRWQALAERGAQPQRLLWASTSTKDKCYSDVKYVEALIGPETVNTMPSETLAAYRERGRPAERLEKDLDATRRLPARLAVLGIDLDRVAEQLEREGIDKFVKSYDALVQTLDARFSSREPCRSST